MKPEVLSRMHTAEHIFVGSLIKQNKEGAVEKVKLDPRESRVILQCEGLDWNQLTDGEKKTNQIIKENRPVKISEITRQEAENHPQLRVRLDRIKGDTVRVVEVEGHDVSACAGSHCSETGQIGNFLVTGFNSLGNSRYEIRFMVDGMDRLYQLACLARKLSLVVGADYPVLERAVENLKQENERMKQQLRHLQEQQLEKVPMEKVQGKKLCFSECRDFEKPLLIKKAKQLADQDAVCCFLNRTTNNLQVIITTPEGLGEKAVDLLEQLKQDLGGKGGGRENFAMGAFEPGKQEEIITKIKKSME